MVTVGELNAILRLDMRSFEASLDSARSKLSSFNANLNFAGIQAQVQKTSVGVTGLGQSFGNIKIPSSIGDLNNKFAIQNKELSILQQELEKVSRRYGEASTQAQRKELSIAKLVERMKDLGNAGRGLSILDEIFKGAFRFIGEQAVRGVENLIRGVVDLTGKAFNLAAGFEQTLNVFQAISNAGPETMEAVAKKAEELGADLTLPATSARDAAVAMLELQKAGVETIDVIDASKGVLQLAAAAQIEEAEAAEITANALNAFSLEGKEATRVADILAASANASAGTILDTSYALKQASAVAAAANIPVEDLTTAIAQMANAGIKGSDAGTSIRTGLLALQAPTDKAKETMERFNISVFDTEGRMKPLSAIIDEFSTKLREGAVVSLRLSAEELEKIKEKADKAGEQIKKLTEKNAELADKIKEQQGKITDAIQDFARERIQAERDYIDKVTKLNKDYQDKFTDALQGFNDKKQDLEIDYSNTIADIIENQQDDINKVVTDYREKRLSEEASHKEELAEIEQEYGEKVQEIQERINALVEDYNRQRAEKEEDYNRKIVESAQEFIRKREDLVENYNQNLQDRLANYNDKTEDIQYKYNKQLTKLEKDLGKAKTAEQRAAIQEKIDELKEGNKETLEEAKDDFRRQEEKERRHLYKQIELNRQAQDRKHQELLLARKREEEEDAIRLSRAKKALEQQLVIENTAAQTKKENAEKALQLQLQSIDAQQAAELSKEKEGIDKQLQQAKVAYERQQADAQLNYDRQVRDLTTARERELAEEKTTHDKREQLAKESYQREFTELSVQVNKRIAELQKEQQANKDTINATKTELDSLNETLRTGGERLVTITQQMRNDALKDIFGQDAIRFAQTVLTDTSAKFEEMKGKIQEQGAASETAAAQTRGLAGALDGVKSIFESLATAIALPLLPALTNMVKAFGEAVQASIPFIKEFFLTHVKPFVEYMSTKVVNVLSEFTQRVKNGENPWEIIKDMAGRGFEGLKSVMGQLWDWIQNVAFPEIKRRMDKWLSENGPGIADTGAKIIAKLLEGAVKGLVIAGEALWNAYWELVKKLTDNARTEGTLGAAIIDGIRNGIMGAWDSFTGFLRDRWEDIKRSIRESFGMRSPSKVFSGFGTNMMEGMYQGLNKQSGQVDRLIGDLAQRYTSAFDMNTAMGNMSMPAMMSTAVAGGAM